jgi:hypothetical protein
MAIGGRGEAPVSRVFAGVGFSCRWRLRPRNAEGNNQGEPDCRLAFCRRSSLNPSGRQLSPRTPMASLVCSFPSAWPNANRRDGANMGRPQSAPRPSLRFSLHHRVTWMENLTSWKKSSHPNNRTDGERDGFVMSSIDPPGASRGLVPGLPGRGLEQHRRARAF